MVSKESFIDVNRFTKQDLSDPNVIRHFAIETGGRSNLDYLYILTVADINGTNPELWNAWRSTLLRQLM